MAEVIVHSPTDTSKAVVIVHSDTSTAVVTLHSPTDTSTAVVTLHSSTDTSTVVVTLHSPTDTSTAVVTLHSSTDTSTISFALHSPDFKFLNEVPGGTTCLCSRNSSSRCLMRSVTSSSCSLATGRLQLLPAPLSALMVLPPNGKPGKWPFCSKYSRRCRWTLCCLWSCSCFEVRSCSCSAST